MIKHISISGVQNILNAEEVSNLEIVVLWFDMLVNQLFFIFIKIFEKI